MKNLIRTAALAAALPFLVAFAPAPDNCDGCEDISTPISSNGPLYGDPSSYGPGHTYAITVVSAVTRNDGICAMQALSPPWSHVLVCQEAFPCTPRVTITVEVELERFGIRSASIDVDGGTVCTASVSYSDSIFMETLLVAPLFDERVRNHCGNLDCPIDITAEIEVEDYEIGVVTPNWTDNRTLRIFGSLSCTPCGIVPIPVNTGIGD